MPNTSATGGYLSPNLTAPVHLEDDALSDFFQAYAVGLTGIVGKYVRPRWQAEPPNIPPANVTWCAIGIVTTETDTFAAELHVPTGEGYNELRRHEILHLLASFYGPNANRSAKLLRDGMQVSQNREVFSANNMGLVESGTIRTVPELLKEKWIMRVDFPFSIRRQIVNTYLVLNLLTLDGSITNGVTVNIALD